MKRRSWFRVLWIGAGCGLLSLLSGCYFGLVTPMLAPVYVEMPIDLSKAGNTAEAEFRIWFKDEYLLDLSIFSPTENAFKDEQLHKYLRGGDYWYRKGIAQPAEVDKKDKGANIPFHIVIWRKTGKSEHIFMDNIIDTSGVNGSNYRLVYRDVILLGFKPGKYRISVTNLNDHKKLVGYDAILYLYYFRR